VQNFVARSYSVFIEIYGVLVDSGYVYSVIMVVELKISTLSLIPCGNGVRYFPVISFMFCKFLL
jgi:hypothetical protein